MIEGLKIVTAQEMLRIEKLAYDAGAKEEHFMENAGHAVAMLTEEFLIENELERRIVLLAGKGNNGGDGYAAASELLKSGISVSAYAIAPLSASSPLCKKQAERFQKAGGKIHFIRSAKEISFPDGATILAALVGTGFEGKAEGLLAEVIEAANRSELPIIAVDVPAGLNATTGEVESVAIHATQTISLGLPKTGYFINEGWNHIGTLLHAEFGLAPEFIEKAKAIAHLPDEAALSTLLPPIKRNRHKYEAGYVLAIGGSKTMSGAAILSSYAALRAGAGIVRLFYPPEMEFAIGAAPLELLKEPWDLTKDTSILAEAKRAKAAIIGPGMGRTKKAESAIQKLLKKLSLPCVIDADALYFLAKNRSWKTPSQCILTPHRQEMLRLLSVASMDERALHDECRSYVQKKKVTLVLKGGPTFIFHPGTLPLVIPYGDPGMATAGSGDVLTGILAALLAQGCNPYEAAVLGTCLHGISGEFASLDRTSYSMVASDLIEYLSEAFIKIYF